MKQLNATQRKQVNNAIDNFLDRSMAYDDAQAQLNKVLHDCKLTRADISPAVTVYVAQRTGAELTPDNKLVNNRNHKSPDIVRLYNKTQKQITRILNQAKPTPASKAVKRNKVDPLEAEAKRLRSKYSVRQLKALFASLGV